MAMPKDAKKQKAEEPLEIKANAGTFLGSQVAQIASLHVTDVDVTFDFIYVHPGNQTQGQVVARVTVPKKAAEQLATVTLETIKKHNAQNNE
jgi:hypothetical protein